MFKSEEDVIETNRTYIDESVERGRVERVSELWAKCLVVDHPVVTLVPEDQLEAWVPDEPLAKPDVEFQLEWVYGYHGYAEGRVDNSLIYLQSVSLEFSFSFVKVYTKANQISRPE